MYLRKLSTHNKSGYEEVGLINLYRRALEIHQKKNVSTFSKNIDLNSSTCYTLQGLSAP